MCASTPERWRLLHQAALAPLEFASRDDFARLERVVGLEVTLRARLRALYEACDEPGSRAALQSIAALLPAADAPRAERIARWQQVLTQLQHWPSSIAASVPAAPADAPNNPQLLRASPPTAPVAPAPAPTALALQTPLAQVRGIGPQRLEALARREVHSIEDLLRFFPRRYRSRQHTQTLAEIKADQLCTVEGQVQAVRERYVRGRHHVEVMLHDGTGSLQLVWFRAPGRGFASQFVRGARFAVSGTVRRHRLVWQMAHPEVRRLEDIGELPMGAAGAPSAADADADWQQDALVPLYLEVEGLHPQALRRLIRELLGVCAQWPDPLPATLRAQRHLCTIGEAAAMLHAPPADADPLALEARSDPWHRRLIYDELFFLQLGLLRRRAQAGGAERAAPLRGPKPLIAEAAALFPFVLTGAQQRVLDQIEADVACDVPMQRLLQGDVGSGKTAVAWALAQRAWACGQQTALMAPTELLAEQHARNAQRLLQPHGVPVALLTGGQKAGERRTILQELASGRPMVVVGTHALIGQHVRFGALGLAIVDEQHRFGVMQRARLGALGKQGQRLTPHMLVMTATPIPRTLALTVYGDLDTSVIDELPAGRQPIATRIVGERQRMRAYETIVAEVAKGRQAYVVFPLIEASDKEGMEDIRAATQSAEELAAGPLAGLRLALLHGRVGAAEKEAIMQRFARGELDVLIATTVVEVGIDVPNATVIAIEHAERFGLSQLHQLRGRVGRGDAASVCLLLTRGQGAQASKERLAAMAQTTDGFALAEIDLRLRGPGDFVGTRQSGLPMLSMADLVRDRPLLEWARADARALLQQDPQLADESLEHTRRHLHAVWQRASLWVDAG